MPNEKSYKSKENQNLVDILLETLDIFFERKKKERKKERKKKKNMYVAATEYTLRHFRPKCS